MAFCIPQKYAAKFLNAVISGDIKPSELISKTSAERTKFLAEYVGEANAEHVNALFERKLKPSEDSLNLAITKKAFDNWVEKTGNLKPAVKRDLISQIGRMDEHILNPAKAEQFLESLVKERIGATVSVEEAQRIAEMSAALKEADARVKGQNGSATHLDYGEKLVALQRYIQELKAKGPEGLKDKAKAAINDPYKTLNLIAGASKGMKAAFDNSVLFRQGWKTLFTHPTIWMKNAGQSFLDIWNQLKHKGTDNTVADANMAEILSRDNARNGLYKLGKVDLGNTEEAFPPSFLEAVPGLGRLYKASEVAFTNFLYRMRADIFDQTISMLEDTGQVKPWELGKKLVKKVGGEFDRTQEEQVRSVGKLVNSLTGRGDLGSWEKVGRQVNLYLFSPKFLVSNLDFLTAHMFRRNISPAMRMQAAVNLTKVVVGTAAVLSIAEALMPKSVETNPTSSDYGKIRIPGTDTRMDVSGGMGSIRTLAMRLATQERKSAVTGTVADLNTGKYGAPTTKDVFFDFVTNKLSPAASVVFDTLIRHADFYGNPPTLIGESINFAAPLPAQNVVQALQSPKSANALLVWLADGVGLQTNTFSKTKK